MYHLQDWPRPYKRSEWPLAMSRPTKLRHIVYISWWMAFSSSSESVSTKYSPGRAFEAGTGRGTSPYLKLRAATMELYRPSLAFGALARNKQCIYIMWEESMMRDDGEREKEGDERRIK